MNSLPVQRWSDSPVQEVLPSLVSFFTSLSRGRPSSDSLVQEVRPVAANNSFTAPSCEMALLLAFPPSASLSTSPPLPFSLTWLSHFVPGSLRSP